ncbi:ArnT family glycosyltransferase [Hyphomicrobium sp.]|uniref:ArnT family glycosyltransferase n=1 Tax=Hyphomicrobium sp. TaxID=82 RepID=UPI002E359E27|nr:glycosyltransferase family 39 protein [Hyphomicrobium sp.]HEX2839664.1 glycosyltransferase family 39 protein [Hyphomicrobium sp.]
MTTPPFALERTAFAALVVGLCLLVLTAASLPAMPVDETRYLTVAWEMRANDSWVLPTLNFEPYSHKPPLLFWLINALWSVLGLEVWPARLVGFASMGVTLFLTGRLDRALAQAPESPEQAALPARSVLILLGLPVFLGLGFAIMFDMLLTVTAVGALLALWNAGKSGGYKPWLLYGLCIGLGLLAKGPVVLLYVLPPALLGYFWIDPERRRGWYVRLVGAVGLGAAIGLAWALRAAMLGGPEYAEMIFWKQSAGRMASSFAHARPLWFYVPIAVFFFLPVILWRPVREALRTSVTTAGAARNFLFSWLLPAFAGLSVISGKQLHYFLPLVPGIAILISLGLRKASFQPSDSRMFPIFASAAGIILVALLATARKWAPLPPDGTLSSVVANAHLPSIVAATVVAISVFLILNRSVSQILIGIAMANVLLLGTLCAESRSTVAHLYDLRPMSKVIAELSGRPIAATDRSRGEFGFFAKLRSPVVLVPVNRLACWMASNPEGAVIVRSHLDEDELAETGISYRTIYQQTYRNDELWKIVEAKDVPQRVCGSPGSGGEVPSEDIAPD